MKSLIEKAVEGDKYSFSLIFLELQNDLYRIALSKTRNKDDAFDAIQETMLITYKNIDQLKSIESLKSWIIKILINECYKIYNKENKVKVISIQDPKFYDNIKENDWFPLKESDYNIEFKELLECLNDKEKIIMILYYENSYKIKEISNIMKIKENTIKSIIKRSKNKIKNNLKGD